MSDYISREAAFNAILKLIPKVDDDGYCWVIRGDAATAIDNIPAADVRPVVRGKWIYGGQKVINETFPIYICSYCKKAIPAEWERKCNFCPSCGADMRLPNEEKIS